MSSPPHPSIPDITTALIAPEIEENTHILLQSLKASGSITSTENGQNTDTDTLQQRLSELKYAQSLRSERTTDEWSTGDNIEPVGRLAINDADMWCYLQVAHFLRRMKKEQRTGTTGIDGDTNGAEGKNKPLVAGLIAPAGGGKSTLVTVIKMLLEEVVGKTDKTDASNGASNEEKNIRCAIISIDDFLTTGPANEGPQRQQHEIRTRWDCHATDVDLGKEILEKLMKLGRGGEGTTTGTEQVKQEIDQVEVPRFQLSTDTRLSESKVIESPIDFLLFEGWRVGIDHPNFYEFNKFVDTLIYLESDFEAILNFKLEKIKRDMAANGGYDLYNLVGRKYGYGGNEENGDVMLDFIFKNHYFAVAEKYILPCRGISDVILRKGEGHHIELVEFVIGAGSHAHDGEDLDENTKGWKGQKDGFESRVRDVHIVILDDVDGKIDSCIGMEAGICVEHYTTRLKRRDGEINIGDEGKGDYENSPNLTVQEFTRGWGGGWILELPHKRFIRAKVVVWGSSFGGEDENDSQKTFGSLIQENYNGEKRWGSVKACPWDRLPAKVFRTRDKSVCGMKEIGENTNTILVLGSDESLRTKVLEKLENGFGNVFDFFIVQRHEGNL